MSFRTQQVKIFDDFHCLHALGQGGNLLKPIQDHQQYLIRRLREPAEAIAYLREFLKDDGEGDHWPLLLQAVRNVARAHSIGSDLRRVDAIRDVDIDYSDSPTPDLADWVKYATCFAGPPGAA